MKNAETEGEDKKPLEFKDLYTEIEEDLKSLFKRAFLLGQMQGIAKAGNELMKLKLEKGGVFDGTNINRPAEK